MTIPREQRSSIAYRFLFLITVSIVVLTLDLNLRYLEVPRQVFSWVTNAIYHTTNSPQRFFDWSSSYIQDRNQLLQELEALEEKYHESNSKSITLESITRANTELRQLLGLVQQNPEWQFVAAKIVGIVPDPSRNEIVLDRGIDDGVTDGMVVVDSEGVYGQVVQALSGSCVVILITDARLAVPARIQRTGLNAIVAGKGDSAGLALEHASITADIQRGDLLVTSGLAGVYPFGYPIGTVSSIEPDIAGVEAHVDVEPTADIHRRTWLLIVTSSDSG